MLSNNTITYYHKTINPQTRLEEWNRYLFEDVWEFGSLNASANRGYTDNNNVQIRIPMEKIQDVTIFTIGDLVAIGNNPDITTRSDLENIEFYNITNIKINDFGSTPHVHLGGQ